MKEFEDKKFNTKDDFGRVKTGPRNFLGSNCRSGLGATTFGNTFSKYPYESDPYNRERD